MMRSPGFSAIARRLRRAALLVHSNRPTRRLRAAWPRSASRELVPRWCANCWQHEGNLGAGPALLELGRQLPHDCTIAADAWLSGGQECSRSGEPDWRASSGVGLACGGCGVGAGLGVH